MFFCSNNLKWDCAADTERSECSEPTWLQRLVWRQMQMWCHADKCTTARDRADSRNNRCVPVPDVTSALPAFPLMGLTIHNVPYSLWSSKDDGAP